MGTLKESGGSAVMIGEIDGPTLVTFPAGAVHGTSPVIAIIPLDGRSGLVTAQTPFHPVDHTWPDHPADLGIITVDVVRYPVVDCVIGAARTGTGSCHLGESIPACRGEEGWTWFVVHVVSGDVDGADLVGRNAELMVDPVRRAGLSAGHTACELVTLAINRAFADRWRKVATLDRLGNPDFDKLAITSSRIFPYSSRDDYRLGKSLRKKGFVAEGLDVDLELLTRRINDQMNEWVAENAPVQVDVDGPELTAFRTWNCGLRNAAVSVPCGGTHVNRTAELGKVTVTLELDESGTALTMHTVVEPVDEFVVEKEM